jgi:hypothetical protein
MLCERFGCIILRLLSKISVPQNIYLCLIESAVRSILSNSVNSYKNSKAFKELISHHAFLNLLW